MLFLLHIRVHPRPELSPEQRAEARGRENEAAFQLIRRGVLRRMFRCAGSNLSYSLWEAGSAEELDAALRTLPNFPFIADVTVTPLVKHPLEAPYEQEVGPLPPSDRGTHPRPCTRQSTCDGPLVRRLARRWPFACGWLVRRRRYIGCRV